MEQSFPIHVNGQTFQVALDDPDTPLLYVLRDSLGLHGPKFGCGLGQCGACTVLKDDVAVRSCVTPVRSVGSSRITTLEGLATAGRLHPVQEAFVHEQAAQCGYCMNGMIMQSVSLLRQNPHPTVAQIRAALATNLCRCGTHVRIQRAVQRAASSSGEMHDD